MENWKARCRKCGDFNPAAFDSRTRERVNQPSFVPLYVRCPNPRCWYAARIIFNTTVLDVSLALFQWDQAEYVSIRHGRLIFMSYPDDAQGFMLLRNANPSQDEMFVRLPNVTNYFKEQHGNLP